MDRTTNKTQLEVLLNAIKLKNKPQQLANFIRKNKEFIPGITENELKQLEKSF